MPEHIAIIQGHPDPGADRFWYALADERWLTKMRELGRMAR
jgi:hypothetical protein